MAMLGARTKFYHYNTLACLLKALEGKRVTVEIRGNITLCGTLEIVYPDMSLDMSDVARIEVTGKQTTYERFYIRSRQIGMVHIPDEVDIVKAIQWQLKKASHFQEKERREQAQKRENKLKFKQRIRAKPGKKGAV